MIDVYEVGLGREDVHHPMRNYLNTATIEEKDLPTYLAEGWHVGTGEGFPKMDPLPI